MQCKQCKQCTTCGSYFCCAVCSTTQADKAAVLGEQLGVELQGEHMLLSHTPMAMLAEKYRDELVLLVGKKRIKDIAHAYGFRNVMTTKELHTLYPRSASKAKGGRRRVQVGVRTDMFVYLCFTFQSLSRHSSSQHRGPGPMACTHQGRVHLPRPCQLPP